MNTQDILGDLIAFPTVSADSNRALIDYCANLLRTVDADITIIEDLGGHKANLYATIGPKDVGGVLLSGHTDVVPVEGQDWTTPPFQMTAQGGNLFGRGTADMKGFVACALSAALSAGKRNLKTPLHLALSYDEEIGCVGVRSMIEMLANAPFRPRLCIVGEPTLMAVATGHKGKSAYRVTCTGVEAHSALAPTGLNAIHMACDMITGLRDLQHQIASGALLDDDYDVPYSTIHVGKMSGGVALNIVPNHSEFMFEIRNISQDDPQDFLADIQAHADQVLAPLRRDFPNAAIDIDMTNTYPPLDTSKDAEIVGFVKSLTGTNSTIKVAFGTEGGLFASQLNIPTVICGPGSMAQGHKPDEFVSVEQLEKCDAMLAALLDRLERGINLTG